MQLSSLLKLTHTKVSHVDRSFYFFKIYEGSSLLLLLPISDVNEEEGLIREEKNFLGVGDVATLYLIVVEKLVWHLHERFMHAVLSVEESVWVASLNQPREK